MHLLSFKRTEFITLIDFSNLKPVKINLIVLILSNRKTIRPDKKIFMNKLNLLNENVQYKSILEEMLRVLVQIVYKKYTNN